MEISDFIIIGIQAVIGCSFYFYWLETVSSSHCWAAPCSDESLALGTLREREHRFCQESHHLSEAFYQKHFARGILLSRRFV